MQHARRITEGLFQRTLKRPVRFSGVGLHSGARITMTLSPAEAGSGITFLRTDKRGAAAVLPAAWDRVVDTRLCTVLGNDAGTTVGTVEHLMAALRGCGIDNAEIAIDGAEVAIMDGSSAAFVEAIASVGTTRQSMPRRVIRILKPVTAVEGHKTASFTPDDAEIFSFEIDFDSAAIANQTYCFELTDGAFGDEIGRARTFGFLHEVEMMRRMGLARGGSLDNAIVIDRDRVMNEGGLRYSDEFVRHKILDAVGDLYLAGASIVGRFHGHRSGHALNNKLLRTLFADSSAWCWDTPAETLVPAVWSHREKRLAVA
ncbi:UDP-3-O-acyl-N-acetylglucosamine deacetylase [Azospirillum sp. RWY-5-1]|uniref:UDP-3-O-acyl-N-acetylglucosamine deacetylase n=1 Tax=Azospirillum oleiclasticum TaxID=2735135 RepID=A0ABX2TG84_9PROT|nr:UDP-3-O-acyl-N-acetylglucosamine deacetylase [Azospirillum oleiclasticum]NYZ21695.1 UDP-3-O-acyl-N-acetylglucosamine deacetylase [Azospirillum oleiclasticum]